MNRTKCVASVAWSVLLTGTIGVAGCTSCTAPPPIDAGPAPDALALPDVGRDAPDTGDPVLSCGTTGSAGAHCRAGSCASSATCTSPMPQTVQTGFGLAQAGVSDPLHPGYRLVQTPLDPAESAPLDAFAGGMCTQQCDTRASLDTCGTCASCSGTVTQLPLLAAFGGAAALVPAASRSFGAQTGFCRLDCTWNPATRGEECPTDMTCDAFGSVCIEACTNDNECNTGFAFTYAGQLVTALETDHPRTCNLATGRCESAGHAGAQVGDRCTSEDDCASGVGVCLAGGLCAELGCPNPDTSASSCAGGRGVCLSVNRTTHPQSLCLRGCNGASDCGAGNACQLLGTGVTIGTFAGYCLGSCSSDDECMATETCTDVTTTDASGATTVQPGRCVPRCTSVGGVGTASGGCALAEACLADHTGAAYGHCDAVDAFCGAPNARSLPAASTECATGWVCDELLAGVAGRRDDVADGHCAPACVSDTDCTGRGTCVTTGPLAGLCRVACTSAADCSAPSVCDTALGWCVEAAPPAGP